MTKSDLLDKIKVLLKKMQDHDTPEDVTNKEELGPLLKDSEELLETVSVLKYLIEEEDLSNETSRPEDIGPEQTGETMTPLQEAAAKHSPDQMEEATAEPTAGWEETSETDEVDTRVHPENTKNGAQEVSTINETVAPPTGGASVASQLEREVVNDLQSAIGVNERFLYINELFEGDGDAYNTTLVKLDAFANLPEALKYVRNELSEKYTWDQEQESTISFYALIE